MPIELRILTGARAGQSDYFEKNIISIGRHPASDFLLDIKKDLDVSRRHGEIRFVANGYRLYDKDSTNGTFLNDEQLEPGGNRDIEDGDTIRFGAQGPSVSVIITGVAPRVTPLANAVVTPAQSGETVAQSAPEEARPQVSSLAAKLQERLNAAERRSEAVSRGASVERAPSPRRFENDPAKNQRRAEREDAVAEHEHEHERSDRKESLNDRPRSDFEESLNDRPRAASGESPKEHHRSNGEDSLKEGARSDADEPARDRSRSNRAQAVKERSRHVLTLGESTATEPSVDVTAEPKVPGKSANRLPTVERVAMAVKKQTRALRYVIVAVLALAGGLAGGMYFYAHRETASRDAEIQRLLAANEEATRQFQTKLEGMNDTGVANALQRRLDSLIATARYARDDQSQAAVREQLRENQELQRRINAMDVPAVRNAIDPAVALIVSEIGGRRLEATGFTVTSAGLLVTNRHVVSDSNNTVASKIFVKFANTKEWKSAHVVKLDAQQNVDLAVLQVDGGGQYQPVGGIATTIDDPVGAPVATIGFPMGTDSPMEGPANDFTAKTSLTIGRISKLVPGLLQIDAFAAHGSSGSPVVDEHGRVVGVVWGGPRGAGGRIVFAVPADKIAALVNSVK